MACDGGEILGRGVGIAGLDDVDAETGELAGDGKFLAAAEAGAGRLLAIAQGGIED